MFLRWIVQVFLKEREMKINLEDFEIDSLLHSLICLEKYNSIHTFKKHQKCWRMLEQKFDWNQISFCILQHDPTYSNRLAKQF